MSTNVIHLKNIHTGSTVILHNANLHRKDVLWVPAAGYCPECGAPKEEYKPGFGIVGQDGHDIYYGDGNWIAVEPFEQKCDCATW